MKHPLRPVLCGLLLFLACAAARPQSQPLPPDAVRPDWKSEVPLAVHPDTGLVSLYYKTWELAAGRVRRGPEGLPASPYLDENCYDDQIWIWDTCFMTLFSKYAPKAYPGKETLLNCYVPIHDHVRTPLLIHLRDNPPLFAWAELENYQFLGDTAQTTLVLERKRYLQRHFDYFNSVPKGDVDTTVSPAYNPIHRDVVRGPEGQIIGYTWTGNGSGMDNTVRGRGAGGWDSILWVDAISQQALSALSIARLLRLTGRSGEAELWQARYDTLRATINRFYWDEEAGCYFDISRRTLKPCRVLSVASFWPLLAEVASPAQAERMLRWVRNGKWLGGTRPWNSLSRSDPDFNGLTGDYWRGSVWLPTAYMGTKALEKYGYYALADTLAERVVRHQLRTYEQYAPHTIWECYNPSADEPSTEWGHRVRPDFCGWSALGPISLFIENIMGFRHADAPQRTLTWTVKRSNGTHGLRRLRWGDVEADILYQAPAQRIEVKANRPFTLIANDRRIRVKAGAHSYRFPGKWLQ